MDAHQAETVRGVRTPIVVRPEPDAPVIVRFLFVISAERVLPSSVVSALKKTRGSDAERFNAGRGRAGALVRITRRSNCASRIALSYDVAKNLIAGRAVVLQDYSGFAPAARAHPIQVDGERLPLRLKARRPLNCLRYIGVRAG
jgi:hypothetical protein